MTLKSGATLDITRSPFVTGHKLFKTILKELKDVNLKLGLKEGHSIGEVFNLELTDDAINTAKNGILTLMSSQDIEDSIWECMGGRVLYNNKKVEPNLFNDETVAEDFLEIFKEVMVYNLTPFRKSLESLFPNIRLLKKVEDQTSK